jgi:hypothetical protein
LDIVPTQSDCNDAFREWADTMTARSRLTPLGWVIEGKGVLFTNYGHGGHGEIKDQVMLGVDPDTNSSTVKIVRPKGARADDGPATVLAVDDRGHRHLLREGRLTANKVSGFVIDKFAELSGLAEVPLMIAGERSDRHWYVVADLDSTQREIVERTAAFSLACARARALAGGGRKAIDREREDGSRPTYGLDEKGRITKRTVPGGTTEVRELQGYVFKALKKIVGEELRKPKRNGYCVDGMIEPANLLIEIKTSTAAHSIYEAVGQLNLYPRLIGIGGAPERALVIPDQRPLNPVMVAALDGAGISVFTYSIDDRGKKPLISFSNALIERCRFN